MPRAAGSVGVDVRATSGSRQQGHRHSYTLFLFFLESRREGKVKQITTTQMKFSKIIPVTSFWRDSLRVLTTRRKSVTWLMHLFYRCKFQVLYVLYVHPPLSITDSRLQFINLPYSVSQSSDENESKSDGDWKNTKEVSLKEETKGGQIRRQRKLKLK